MGGFGIDRYIRVTNSHSKFMTKSNRTVHVHSQIFWRSHHIKFSHDAFSGSILLMQNYAKRIFGTQKIHLTGKVSNLPLLLLTLEITCKIIAIIIF